MKKLIILIICAVVVMFVCSSNEYVEIPSTSIRMRVIASSNNTDDQNDKKIIKSVIEEKLYELNKNNETYEEIDQTINNNLDNLSQTITEAIDNNSMGITFKANYGYNYFPEKEFKGVKYKSGNYKSYVVTLGDGDGENWWCVLYPPLCLIDENKDDYEYHSLIKDTIDKYN